MGPVNTVRGLPFITSELRLKLHVLLSRHTHAGKISNHSSCVHFGVVNIIIKLMQATVPMVFTVTAYPHASYKASENHLGLITLWYKKY